VLVVQTLACLLEVAAEGLLPFVEALEALAVVGLLPFVEALEELEEEEKNHWKSLPVELDVA
jgi:hypothetical protein